MFLDYGGDKEFDVKSYVDASLTPIRIALSRDIQISVKVCIGVTLYDELFNHLHNRENSLVH